MKSNKISNQVQLIDQALQAMHEDLRKEAIKNHTPTYYSALGLSVEVWHDKKTIFIEATDEVLEKLNINKQELIQQVL